MTVTTRPPRVAPRPEAPIAPVLAPPAGRPGHRQRARLSASARGTRQADRHRAVHRRPGLSRCLVRPHDPLDRPSRAAARRRARPRLRLVEGGRPHRQGPARRQHRQPHQGRPADPRRRHDPAPGGASGVCLPLPDRETLREAKQRITIGPSCCRAVFDPLEADPGVRPLRARQGRHRARVSSEADLVIEGTYRVGHQEQLYIENNAMIAVPRPDGGITIHGSMQCPYYIHKAMKHALKLTDSQAVIIQAETGGGFGGKEEYPSVIAIHAALLAQRVGKPVRMIYDRHEDLAATTKRHPAIVTHRTGVKRDGTLVAQDIEVVMDGGAYCTLSPVVLSRGTLHAGGPYVCPNVRIFGQAVATNTPPNGAFRGFGAPQTEFAAEMQVNRIAEALGMSPLELRRQWVYRLRRRDAVAARSCARASPAKKCSSEPPRRPSSSASTPRRASPGAERESAQPARPSVAQLTSAADRTAHGIGLALAWHGAGFTGSGEVKLASVASAGAHRRRPDSRPDRLDRDGPGHQDDLSAARGRAARRPIESAWRWLPRTRRSFPTADRQSRRARRWSSVAWSSRPPRECAPWSRSMTGKPFAERIASSPSAERRPACRPAVRALSQRQLRRRDLPRRRLPGIRLGRGRCRGRRGPGHRRDRCPQRRVG